jgi:N-acetylglucosaminyl-diphospho-decaprenol L-rhamnosyltransferase
MSVALDLATVVVSWNVRDLVVACLESVSVATDRAGLRAEIWVVDNASSDGSVEALQRWVVQSDAMQAHLIASPVNLWFGGGQNLAFRALGFPNVPLSAPVQVSATALAIGDLRVDIRTHRPAPRYVLILNPDTLVRPAALDEMVRFMEANPKVGICGPRLVYPDGRFQHSAYRFPSLAQTFFEFWPINWRLTESSLNGRYPRQLYAAGQPFQIDHPLGAAMLFRRQVIEETGGFDLDYRMYVEEIDWCWRARLAGWSAYCVPRAEVVHYEGQSTRQVRPQMIVDLWRSRYRLFRKFYSPLYRWLTRRLIRAGMRAEIRCAQRAFAPSGLDDPSAKALRQAYQRVIEM